MSGASKGYVASSFAILLFATLCFATPSIAGFGFKLDGTLDKDAISHAYFEGEFHRVLPPLETFRQSFPGNATREDSIFTYKYLAVIYAADATTRAKAESYMVQLLKLMPTIELIDLYISDNIQAIFKNVKSDFLKQQEYVRDHDSYGNPKQTNDSIPTKAKSPGTAVWWFAGSVGLAAAVGTAVYLYEPEEKQRKTYVPIWQGGEPQSP